MLKHLSLLTCVLFFASGQVCDVTVTPVTGTPLREADAVIQISRDADDDTARVEAEITRGLAGVRMSEGQRVEVNDEELAGTRGTFTARVDAAGVYTIDVVDPRRGTDKTDIAEPDPIEITSPGEDGDASLSGFTIEWTDADAALDVEIEITQRLFDETLSLRLDAVEDTGSAVITSSQIAKAGFGQGKPMTITITRIRTENNVRGFDDGRAECRLSVSIDVNPAP